MDVITKYIHSLEDSNDEHHFHSMLANQWQYFNMFNNLPTKHVNVLREIHQIPDINGLQILSRQCAKHYEKRGTAKYFDTTMKNIECIKNAHKQPNAQNIRPFYEYEIDLLNTLHKITYIVANGRQRVTFILNTFVRKIEFDANMTLYVSPKHTNKPSNIANCRKWNIDMQNSHAFGAKMTTNEYRDFISNLILCISLCMRDFHLYNFYTSFHKPSVNIADLLLCAINEQYPKNITFVEMNIADRVFYDTYLLKCITSVKFL